MIGLTVVGWVFAVLFLIGLIIYATVAIRRCDDTVRDPRAITAKYEKKLQEQDTERIYHDWESYYRDGDRGNDDEPPAHLRRPG